MNEWQKCPVCEGSGLVSGGFYDHPSDCDRWASDHTTETCRTCQGKGIIVKPEPEVTVTEFRVPETTG